MQALLEQLITRRYSKRTIDSYLYWVRYYIRFHGKRHPAEMGAEEVMSFLTFLSLALPLGSLGELNRSVQQRELPVVLTREEVRRLLERLRGSQWLLASLLYGSGLRRIEAVRLRVKDVDFDHLQLRIWVGMGNKHRITTLAPELLPALKRQVENRALLHEQDLDSEGYTGVWLPHALGPKYPAANRQLGRHYLFPSSSHQPA
jgi:integrase